MYVYVLRNKETGAVTAEKSRFGLPDDETREIMFRATVAGSVAADELVVSLNLSKMQFGNPDASRVDMSTYYEVLKSRNRALVDIEDYDKRAVEQARIIRDKNSQIENLENEIAVERTKTRDREVVLKNVMNELALDMALLRTHQQRNAAMRHIVRLIKVILDNVADMDDIPY